MKRWVKGFIITGVVMLCAGTGMTAAAAVMSHGRIGDRDSLGRTRQFYNDYLRNILPARWSEELEPLAQQLEDGLTFDEDDWQDWWDSQDFSDGNVEGVLDDLGQRIDENLKLPSKDEMKLAASYQNVNSLELQVEGGFVKVVENGDLHQQINIYIADQPKWRVTSEKDEDSAGEISVKYRYSGTRNVSDQMVGIVEVPAGFRFSETELKARGGVIKADGITAGKVNLEAEGGAVLAQELTADNLELDIKGGAMTASGQVNNKVEAEVKAGAAVLTLNGSKEDFSYETDNAAGTIRIDGYAPSTLRQLNGVKKMELNCTAGSLKINFKGR